MLREEQIDIRRQRAAQEQLRVVNLGRNRVFSDYQVTNPDHRRPISRQHSRLRRRRQHLRMSRFPHQHARHLQAHRGGPRRPQGRDAAAAPPPQGRRHPARNRICTTANNCASACICRRGTPTSCATWPTPIFDPRGLWQGGDRYQTLIEAVENVPEQVTIFSDAMEFMEREIDRREMALREQELLFQLEEAEKANEPLPLQDLLTVPLYPYQMRGALFAACRGRCILGDDMGLGKTVQTMAAVEMLARERGIERVLVVAPASVKYQWETRDPQVHGPAGAGHRGHHRPAPAAVRAADVLSAHQLRNGRPRPRRAQRLAARPDRARRGPAHQELGVEDDAAPSRSCAADTPSC